jgi:hypothetical protein
MYPESTSMFVVSVPNIPGSAVSVAATNTASFVVLATGEMLWWGTLYAGMFPHVASTSQTSSPILWDFISSGIFAESAPLLKNVYVAAEYDANLKPTMFLVTQSNETFSFGSNAFGQLCRGVDTTSTPAALSAGKVTLGQGFDVQDIVQADNAAFILTTNGTVLGCGFNGRHLIANEGVYCFSSPCPIGTSNFTSPRPMSFPKPIREISASRMTVFGVSRDGFLLSASDGAFSLYDDGTGDWSSRRWTTAAGLGDSDFVGAAPLEGYSRTPFLPTQPTQVKIWGRGFRTSGATDLSILDDLKIYFYVTSNGGGEGSVSKRTTSGPFQCIPIQVESALIFGAELSIWDDKVVTCRGGYSAAVGWTLSAEFELRGERSTRFYIGLAVPNPSVSSDSFAQTFAAHSGTRVLPVVGANFGNVTEDVAVYFYFGDSSNPITAQILSVTETQIDAQVLLPQLPEDAVINVDVYRLTARHSDAPASWGYAISRALPQSRDTIRFTYSAPLLFQPGASRADFSKIILFLQTPEHSISLAPTFCRNRRRTAFAIKLSTMRPQFCWTGHSAQASPW